MVGNHIYHMLFHMDWVGFGMRWGALGWVGMILGWGCIGNGLGMGWGCSGLGFGWFWVWVQDIHPRQKSPPSNLKLWIHTKKRPRHILRLQHPQFWGHFVQPFSQKSTRKVGMVDFFNFKIWANCSQKVLDYSIVFTVQQISCWNVVWIRSYDARKFDVASKHSSCAETKNSSCTTFAENRCNTFSN